MIKALEEKRNGLLVKMAALAQGESFDAEKRTQFDAMNAECTQIEEDIARLKALEDRNAELRRVEQPARDQPGAPIEDDAGSVEERKKRERRAFEQYIR